MQSFLRDVVWAYKSLRATPGAALAAVLTIALGAGVNTAVIAVAYGVLLRPSLCPDPSRLVVISLLARNGNEVGIPLPEIEDWRRGVRAFQATGAYSAPEFTVRGLGEPRVVRTALVTPSFFDVLRVAPRAGRVPSRLDPDEWMVLGSSLIPPALHDAGDVLGRAVTAGDRSFQVSAVMPAGFGFPSEDVEAWVPAATFPRVRLGSGKEIPRIFRLIGRLKDGVSIEQARDDARRAFAGPTMAREDGASVQVRTLDDVLVGQVRPALRALVAAAVLVLFVACGNVATLLVSRAAARSRDLAVRLSLGASPWQLVRGALAESLLLAAGGSVAGLALAYGCVRLFIHTATGIVPRLDAVGIDLPVLAVALGVAGAVTLVCGLAPAAHAIGTDFRLAFHGSRATASRTARVTRCVLVVAQIAISIVLLNGAGLIARTVLVLLSDSGGADPDRALVAKVVMADTPRFDLESRMLTIGEVLRRVRALPGVEHAAFGTNIPPRVSQIQFNVEETSQGRSVTHTVHLISVTSDFFAALGIRVLEGRVIDEADEQRDGPVIVLSESAAQLLSPGESLVGRDLPWPLPAGAGNGRRPLVAGVVANVKYRGLDAPALPAIYTRWADLPSSVSNLVVRTSGDPVLVAGAVRKTLRLVDSSLPVTDIHTLRQEYSASIADRRIRLIPATAFAVLATAVALVGLWGLLTRAVTERRRELAIRTVLGAPPAVVVGTIMREGILLAAAGVVFGLGASVGATMWLRSLLYGVRPLDPMTFTAVALLVCAAALVTSFWSARGAARIEPLELLRVG